MATPATAFQRPADARARIRMYRVGLGDCFLLTFYTQAAPAHMLIDCGVFAGSRLDKKQKEKQYIDKIVQHIAAETGNVLDVVVVTHEHMDHVSIFNSSKELFDGIQFKQAWFGWVENPEDQDALKLRQTYEGMEMALGAALGEIQPLAGAGGEWSGIHAGVSAVAALAGFAADGSKVKEQPRAAMDYVKERAGKDNLKFGYPGQSWKFAGLTVHVLGPPKSGEQMKIMERAGATYDHKLTDPLRLRDAFGMGEDGMAGVWQPFPEHWRRPSCRASGTAAGALPELAIDENRSRAPVSQALRDLVDLYSRDRRYAWRRIDNDYLAGAAELALQMDDYTNNTSLVLAFEFEDGDVLLFPGDAQVGSWDAWFEREDAKALLKRTIFYKVGHHGSHNGTFKAALEQMTNRELVAMLPTNQRFAWESKHWRMPAPKLRKALEEHTAGRILRIDQGSQGVPDPLQAATVGNLKARVDVHDLYIDYYV